MHMATARQRRSGATLNDPRWATVIARDRRADGQFVYAVRTTGIYCRPSCGSRHARPENVEFHAGPAEAERAGFRACRRCRPDRVGHGDPAARLVAELCRTIERAESPPRLEDLARRAGLSPFHLHRVFKSVTGVTPRQYAEAHRSRRLRSGLSAAGRVTDAIYDAGFGSSGRFYGQSQALLGMTPTRYRAGGADTEIRFAIGECSLGSILVAASQQGVCSILLGDDPEALVRDLQDRFPRARLIGGDADFERLVAQVVGLVESPAQGHGLPLDVRGTAFQQRVWQALRAIPPGQKVSYSELARRIGAPRSVRAVAQAVASNPVAVAIPCHRVVRLDGDLAGYRWGVERKRRLLEREAAA
jgi:AraC family transcriptional regulator of adaptative response/methylated-DNA-[protein]-cysteine methyltransferase